MARLRHDPTHQAVVQELTRDSDEDVYIRLEGAAYLVAVCGMSAEELFDPFLASTDAQTQLETVLALGETGTGEAIEMLIKVLDSKDSPYFLRAASAWCLGQLADEKAVKRLIRAFADFDLEIREQALDGLATLDESALPFLLEGLSASNSEVAAGCAEALRQKSSLPSEVANAIADRAKDNDLWTSWLLGYLPRSVVAARIAELQDSAPEVHYAISLLWTFAESWIARRWELSPRVG